MTSKSRSSLTSGTATCATARIVPRAFLWYVIERVVTMPRTVGGSPAIIASPLVISARFMSAIACTEPKWLRFERRSGISTTARPGSSMRMRGATEPE
jgi:hypothetical protein